MTNHSETKYTMPADQLEMDIILQKTEENLIGLYDFFKMVLPELLIGKEVSHEEFLKICSIAITRIINSSETEDSEAVELLFSREEQQRVKGVLVAAFLSV